MNRKKNKAQTDAHLFQQAMDDVKPLQATARTDSKAPRPCARVGRHENEPAIPLNEYDVLVAAPCSVNADDGTSHRKNGVQKRILLKLKRGRFQLGDQMDLHHMNIKTGTAALLSFIVDSQARSLECIRIIHGKGLRSEHGPKLKTMTRQLLRDHPQVLAFTASKPADGGDGATDVLLKT